MTTLTEGARYEVTTDEAKLVTRHSTGPWAWRFDSRPLDEGEILTYRGKRPGLGHDNVDHDTFERRDGTVGEYKPNHWGRANRDTLTAVTDE